MKLGKLQVPKLSRITWIGAGAVVTAGVVDFLSTRGGASSGYDPYAQPPYSELPGGSTEPPDDGGALVAWDPITTAPQQSGAFASETPAFSAPAPVQRSVATAPVTQEISYVDRFGNPATLEQIFAQTFTVAQPSPPVYQAPAAPVYRASYVAPAPAPVVVSSIPERFRSLFGLEAVHGDGGARDPFAADSAYSYVAPSSSYQAPIIASSLKTPGGGLAYPAMQETAIGGLESIHGAGGARDPFAGDAAVAGGGGGGGSW